MPYTSHGHPYGVIDTDQPRPTSVARCGGPAICPACKAEVAQGSPGVEPPADVAATPDPRQLRIQVMQPCTTKWRARGEACKAWLDGWHHCNGHEPHADHHCDCGDTCPSPFVADGSTPAPAGLSAAQKIRLRVLEVWGPGESGEVVEARNRDVAWVEHGPDETADHERTRWEDEEARANQAEARAQELDIQLTRAVASSEALQTRADLAEARLGQVDDICRDLKYDLPQMFLEGIRDALAWTPDDTAPAGAAKGAPDGE